MIAVDTSALVAILFREPEAAALLARLGKVGTALVGAPTMLEFIMVARGRADERIVPHAQALVASAPFRLVPFDERHLAAAADAFARFGKGLHPARLNFGDCMAYAVAKVAACPLLYKGDDFARTDIAPALA